MSTLTDLNISTELIGSIRRLIPRNENDDPQLKETSSRTSSGSVIRDIKAQSPRRHLCVATHG